jgi:protein-arginine kinase activator protein McsA
MITALDVERTRASEYRKLHCEFCNREITVRKLRNTKTMGRITCGVCVKKRNDALKAKAKLVKGEQKPGECGLDWCAAVKIQAGNAQKKDALCPQCEEAYTRHFQRPREGQYFAYDWRV